MSTLDWYQSQDYVTVSLKLDPTTDKNAIRAKFGKTSCAILESDKLIWHCQLSNPVLPEKCKIKPAGKRIELKLKKAYSEQWTDLECIDTPQHTALEEEEEKEQPNVIVNKSENEQMDVAPICNDKEAEDEITDDETFHTPPTNSPFDDIPSNISSFNSSCTNTDIPQSYLLKHLPHDMVEKNDNHAVFVKIMVSQIIPDSCFITFNRNSLTVQFKTLNNRFLESYPGSNSDTQFSWTINLYDVIVPDKSEYIVTEKRIELVLIKVDPQVKWKSLEGRINRSSLVTPATIPLSSQLNDNISCDQKSSSNGWINNLNVVQEEEEKKKQFNPFTIAKRSGTTTTHDHLTLNNLMDSKPLINSGVTPKITECTNKSKSIPDETEPTQSTSPFFRLSPDLFSDPSLTGLTNMGNSCFMSSIVQCLSNTIEVRDYFLGGQYSKDLNTINPLGSQGKLAECFSVIIDKLWSGKYQYFPPKKLKELIGSKRDEFSGYTQQDAHEFTTFLLDGLHEDLNRITDKPLTPQVESNGRPDAEVAMESWLTYKKRNNSFIVDLFGGQFKSTLVCPECSKESVKFDPFMSLSAPIPQKSRVLSVIFFSKNSSVAPKEIVVSLAPEATLELLKASVATKTNVSMRNLRMFEVYKGKLHSMLSNNKLSISKISDNDTIVISEVLTYHEAKEKVVEIHVIQRVSYPPLPVKCELCKLKGVELKRCGRCKGVAYCSKECQQKNWNVHKNKCKLNIRTPIGLPFVISLPITELTYSKISETAIQFSKWSVDYEKVTSTDEVSMASTATNEHTSLFELVPVDQFGDHIKGEGILKDKGKETLTLSTSFIALDWKNDPKNENSVSITPKDLTVYKKQAQKITEKEGCDITLHDCLQLFTEPETLPKDDAWYCPVCKEHREATKRMSIWQLPPVLIISLKRFSFHNVAWRNKIDKFIKFPLEGLDMSPYLIGDAINQISSDCPPIYDLYATVNHYGAVYLGHYTALIKSPVGETKEWLCYDDDNVTKISRKHVVDNSAYILFYRRRD